MVRSGLGMKHAKDIHNMDVTTEEMLSKIKAA